MADEQHGWLDKEAAERLFRREPVVPSDGPARQDAERLVAALDAAARTARPATGELPGEAAALAAFRAVPRASARSGGAGRAEQAQGGTGDSGMLAPVRIRAAGPGTAAGSAASRGPRPMRWSRPIRFGLVASLACCAIGGVAVAAGSGVLPGPFGRHGPAPATSVSAAASPEELGSGTTAGEDGTAATPPRSPGRDAKTPDATGSGPTPGGTPSREGTTGAGPDGTDDHAGGASDDTTPGTTGQGQDGQGGRSGEDDDTSSGNVEDGTAAWYAKTLQACRDYRDGTLDETRRKRLVALANGARNLDRFCDRLLDQPGAKGSGSQSDNGNGNSQGEPGDDDSDGGSGTLPSIGFSTASPGPTTAGTPDPGLADAPEPTPSLAAR
ncbi:hypothetical protein [Streptomyces sp. NPDC057682]|uniref:hypothetical protein n=1 Tax=Streptomyces sp. NPDC057682 TaxID=3346210 RepID=UPI0036B8A8C8